MVNKIKVCVVEDLDEIREGFAFLINSSDEFECSGVYSCAEDLLAALPALEPDIVIMDIGLPGMSGIQCTSEIKNKYPGIQVMICSVYDDDDRLFDALAAGANGYILKRASPVVLLDSIKELYHGGSPMSPQIGRRIIEVFRGGKKHVSKDNKYNLSKRELEILELMAAGFRNKEIADKLFISSHTVRSHIYNIYEKLHVQSRVEALNKLS